MRKAKTDGIYWTGRLATLQEVAEAGLGKNNCFINKWNTVQFYLKVNSKLPGEALTDSFVVGYGNKVASIGISDDESLEEEERLAHFTRQLECCLLGFTCERNQSGFLIGKQFDLIAGEPGDFAERVFYQVPVIVAGEPTPGIGRVFRTAAELRQAIIRREFLSTLPRYGMGQMDEIPYILFYDAEQLEYTVFGNFTKFRYDGSKGIVFDYVALKEFSFEEDWYDGVLSFQRSNCFAYVEETLHNEKILTKIDEVFAVDCSAPEPNSAFAGMIPENISHKEWTFIEHFAAIARNEGLYYEKKDLINFHTAVKSNALTVLSGISGIGKSRLVQCYAKALGIDEERYCSILVSPIWQDDSGLIGSVDVEKMVYRPAEQGFLELLIEASKEENQDKLYFVCFEQMNLSRVEHYFSRFLSVLERPEKFRDLELYSHAWESRLYNAQTYPRMVHIGDNVRFVGTINVDETTFHFTDKVLDRVNVIDLHVLPYTSWKQYAGTVQGVLMNEWTFDMYKKLITVTEGTGLSERETELMWKLHCLYTKVGNGLGVSPRVVKQVGAYLANLPKEERDDNISRKEGLDLQICQRVLTKLRGQREQLEVLLGQGAGDSIYQVLNQYSDLSKFEHTREALSLKEQETRDYGYAL